MDIIALLSNPNTAIGISPVTKGKSYKVIVRSNGELCNLAREVCELLHKKPVYDDCRWCIRGNSGKDVLYKIDKKIEKLTGRKPIHWFALCE